MGNIISKIISSHLVPNLVLDGEEQAVRVDQAYIEDHSGVQGMLYFEEMNLERIMCDLAVCYVDHNFLPCEADMEGHRYLQSACAKYGLWYSKAGNGICHQVHLEHFAVPGSIILGANSHTSYCGGIGCLAFGVGSLDVAMAFAGKPFFLNKGQVINVVLKNKLHDWCSAQDVALELLRRYSVSGAKGSIIEFTGDGIRSLSIPSRCVLTQMSVEMGAITAIFPSDDITFDYLKKIGREKDWIRIEPDEDAEYEKVIEVDLDKIEPMVALPSQPDYVVTVRSLKEVSVAQVMIGSCTSGAYEDIEIVSHVLKNRTVNPKVSLVIQPNNIEVHKLLAKNGLLNSLYEACAEVTPPSCDACVGIGYVPASGVNSLRAFCRNFKGRSGCKNDSVYLSSVETAIASAVTGTITDPRVFAKQNNLSYKRDVYTSYSKKQDFAAGLIPPLNKEDSLNVEIERRSYLVPFASEKKFEKTIRLNVIGKLGDDISTDHIIPNGTDIKVNRADIKGLSKYFFYRTDSRIYKNLFEKKGGWIVAGKNFGQGSARENAAIIPKYLGVRGIIAKSFSNRYMKNMVNFGLIPLLFSNESDYEDINEDDILLMENVINTLNQDKILLRNVTKGSIYEVKNILSSSQREILKAGGLISWNHILPKD